MYMKEKYSEHKVSDLSAYKLVINFRICTARIHTLQIFTKIIKSRKTLCV